MRARKSRRDLAPCLGTHSRMVTSVSYALTRSDNHAQTTTPLALFSVVALKDTLVLPRVFALLLGNPLDAISQGEATLGAGQQAVVLGLLAGVWALGKASGEATQREDARGRRKEG